MANFKIYILLSVLISACAVQIPPSGGPPDKTPPEISEVYPIMNTTNYSDDFVRFEFTKYMNKSQVIENLFISPDIEVNYDWSGKVLDVEFLDELKENTTYSVSLGTDYSDLKGNKPEMAYSIIFSTGSIIDSGKIVGKLSDARPEGIFIFAYLLEGINADTLNPMTTKPSYRTQVGSNGRFILRALKPGEYRIFAVKDQMKDGLFDQGIDGFSSASRDINVSYDSVENIFLKIGPPIDKVGPMLYNVEALTSRVILAEFSETLDSSSITKNSFEITDSISGQNILINSAFLELGSANSVKVFSDIELDTSKKYILMIRPDIEFAIRDSSGNIIQDTASQMTFYTVMEPDTNELKLRATFPMDSSQNFSVSNHIDFVFNNSIFALSDNLTIEFVSNEPMKNINYVISYPQENILRIKPADLLESTTSYTVQLKIPDIDTLISITFKTADERNNGGIAGSILDSSDYVGSYLIQLRSKSTDKVISCWTDSKKWKIERIPPGEYSMEIISDKNNNKKYDYGSPFPWEESEIFYFLPGTINIKPRWEVEDFDIPYDGLNGIQ